MKKQEVCTAIMQLELMNNMRKHYSQLIDNFPDILDKKQTCIVQEFLEDARNNIEKYSNLYISIKSAEVIHYQQEFEALPSLFEFVESMKAIISSANAKKEITKETNEPKIELASNSTAMSASPIVSLPKLAVPHFTGDISEYISFRSNFNAIVNPAHIDEVQKLLYLKSSLKGDSSAALQYLDLLPQNYQEAWKILDERFDKPKVMTQLHINAIMNLSIVQKSSSQSLQSFIDALSKHLSHLSSIECIGEAFANAFFYQLVESKLDSISQEQLRQKYLNVIPTVQQTMEFLRERLATIISVSPALKITNDVKNHKTLDKTSYSKSNRHSSTTLVVASSSTSKCSHCNGEHSTRTCAEFIKLPVSERFQRIKDLKLCNNCLSPNHVVNNCRSTFRCYKCSKLHHTLIHFENPKEVISKQTFKKSEATKASKPVPQENNTTSSEQSSSTNATNTTVTCMSTSQKALILLSTAIVTVRNRQGVPFPVRCLLDNGSMHSLASEALVDRLGIDCQSTSITLVGVGGKEIHISRSAEIAFSSRSSSYRSQIRCLIVKQITTSIPSVSFDISSLKIPTETKLADPSFNVSADIDILIGAQHFYELLQSSENRIDLGTKQPTLQPSKLGYIVTGQVFSRSNLTRLSHSMHVTSRVDTNLEKFWQLEEVPVPSARSMLSSEEQFCMDHFDKNTMRNEDGRIIVTIPFNQQLPKLGESSANIPLRKFASNDMSIFSDNVSTTDVLSLESDTHKMLGIQWVPSIDQLCFAVDVHIDSAQLTKRQLLSTLAKIYDPIGLISPLVVQAKLLLQHLWQLKLDWDDPVPATILAQWKSFSLGVSAVPKLQLPRFIFSTSSCSVELHCFSDASNFAYGCCLYVRCISQSEVSIHLLCAKGRVAPLKTTTIPRLELTAAVLSAELSNKVLSIFPSTFRSVYYWTDSNIVIGWINNSPNRYQTFVANRIARIQTLTKTNCWFHCRSAENPADLVSRGCFLTEEHDKSMWFHGPAFLQSTSFNMVEAIPSCTTESLPELKAVFSALPAQAKDDINDELLTKISSFTRLLRVKAYILRFIHNLRSTVNSRLKGFLSSKELKGSLLSLVVHVQRNSFAEAISALSKGTMIPRRSQLSSLNVFLDSDNVLRVGGRIRHSNHSYDKIHPIVLPKNHNLTIKIIHFYHLRYMHCGLQQLISVIRERFWPVSLRLSAKRILRECLSCFRSKPTSQLPIMGDLPAERFATYRRCFHHCGIDFAGPILIKDRYVRKPTMLKAYVAVFVCLTTRAIHLELLTSLSSNAFLEVFRRFIARRGQPSLMMSDNGTNFVGASSELKEAFQAFHSSQVQETLHHHLANEGIDWKFIPPGSPHFGGLWESGVRMFKYHMHRILQGSSHTYEFLNSILVQIEGVLNSRPLSSLSNDPNDFNILTPFHFLTGESFKPIPTEDLTESPEASLDQYRRRTQIVHHFWNRWSKEVLHQFQDRKKWKTSPSNLESPSVGRLALINIKGSMPLNWSRCRIAEIHPGSDNVVRVVTVRLPDGSSLKRSIHKVYLLPLPLNDKPPQPSSADQPSHFSVES